LLTQLEFLLRIAQASVPGQPKHNALGTADHHFETVIWSSPHTPVTVSLSTVQWTHVLVLVLR
jgi:hypothetical protein